MIYRNDISASRVRELFNYDPVTGVFVYRSGDPRWIGKRAGSVDQSTSSGYRRIRIKSIGYLEHRLAWLYIYGQWPRDQIDHVNGKRADNRIANLREATNAENHQTKRKTSANKSGFIGVSVKVDSENRTKKWHAQIRKGRKVFHLGYFRTPEEASAAYQAAKARLHPFAAAVK